MKFSATWLSVAAILANQMPAVYDASVFTAFTQKKKKKTSSEIPTFFQRRTFLKEHQC